MVFDLGNTNLIKVGENPCSVGVIDPYFDRNEK
jgi:hypothetical protein